MLDSFLERSGRVCGFVRVRVREGLWASTEAGSTLCARSTSTAYLLAFNFSDVISQKMPKLIEELSRRRRTPGL